jgi:hypothetical protein
VLNSCWRSIQHYGPKCWLQHILLPTGARDNDTHMPQQGAMLGSAHATPGDWTSQILIAQWTDRPPKQGQHNGGSQAV